MRVFTIEDPHVKDFMQHLFTHDTFIDFEVRGIVLHSFTYFEISGAIGGTDADNNSYCTWDELRPYVRYIIKGKEKPRSMKIIFAHKSPETIHPNAAALFINISYETSTEGDQIKCTTACSQKNFELNKAVDMEWDNWAEEFFKKFLRSL